MLIKKWYVLIIVGPTNDRLGEVYDRLNIEPVSHCLTKMFKTWFGILSVDVLMVDAID